jgi:hypothetical protein
VEDLIIKQAANTPHKFLIELAERCSYTQSERALLKFFADKVARDCRFDLDLKEAERVTGASQRSIQRSLHNFRSDGFLFTPRAYCNQHMKKAALSSCIVNPFIAIQTIRLNVERRKKGQSGSRQNGEKQLTEGAE